MHSHWGQKIPFRYTDTHTHTHTPHTHTHAHTHTHTQTHTHTPFSNHPIPRPEIIAKTAILLTSNSLTARFMRECCSTYVKMSNVFMCKHKYTSICKTRDSATASSSTDRSLTARSLTASSHAQLKQTWLKDSQGHDYKQICQKRISSTACSPTASSSTASSTTASSYAEFIQTFFCICTCILWSKHIQAEQFVDSKFIEE